METKKFKTNIKCSGCVATVTPHLNEAVGEANWNVDITDPAKILSVNGRCQRIENSGSGSKSGIQN